MFTCKYIRLQSTDLSVVRSAFLHMLQALPSQATIVSPAALLRHVSSTRAIQQEGAGSMEEPWNQDLLQALLAAIYKVSMLLKGPHIVSCLFLTSENSNMNKIA